MSETLEYIDKYFNGELSAAEKTVFETRCEGDPAFAEDVAFYIQARAGLKAELHVQKTKDFEEEFKKISSRQQQSKGVVRKLFPYVATVAAACLIIFLGWQFLFKTASSQQLADNYIEKNMNQLSVPMGSAKDSLDQGIAAYNNKHYKEAETIFRALSSRNAEASKYLGIVYLVTEKYDDAILQFGNLANNTQLYANPGLFYEALSLMKRNADGDKVKAKQILEEVIRQDLPGRKEAEDWVKKL